MPAIRGDILQSDADIIVQQVNCRGVMGAGLAKQIASQYPEEFIRSYSARNWLRSSWR